jgi:predicted ABC-type ATPase
MRIQARVGQGGHDVPEDKIISRYYRTLALIKDVIPICDICHIYDNSGDSPFRIFKKRKTEYYYDETDYWNFKDITALTQVANMEKRNLNISK